MAQMKRLATVSLLLVAVFAAAEPAQYTIKVGVDLVNVDFSVTDRKGRLVADLTAENFTVEEDGKKQEVVQFSRQSELPLTLAMLVDTSPSVRPVFHEEKHTAATFIETILRPKDLALVITFDRNITLMQDYSESVKRLGAAIRDLNPGGDGTSLYDAVYLASHEKLAREVGRKAIILISDGDDTTSKYDMSKALIAADRSNVVIYSISNSAPRNRLGLSQSGGSPKTLRKLSEETGGGYFSIGENGDFEKIFEQIAMELRSQYSVAYHSSNTIRDGKFRKIRIVPQDTNLTVRARKGYYAAAEAAAR